MLQVEIAVKLKRENPCGSFDAHNVLVYFFDQGNFLKIPIVNI